MKIYISIPITGRPIEEAKEHAEWLKSSLEAHGHKCITPFLSINQSFCFVEFFYKVLIAKDVFIH